MTDEIVALSYEVRKGKDAKALVMAQQQQDVDRMLLVFEGQLSGARYLLGDRLTAVDLAAVSGLGYYTLRCGDGWRNQYPTLAEWCDRLHQRPSIRSTIPRL